MISGKTMQTTLAIALLAVCLPAACGRKPGGSPEAGRTNAMSQSRGKELQSMSAPVQQTESPGHRVKPAKISSPGPSAGEAPEDQAFEEVDWGQEITLDEIIAMAKSAQIREVEWHIMPNVIRAQASDGRIFHIRNENKGVDLRGKLMNAGVRIGEGGISFRHVF